MFADHWKACEAVKSVPARIGCYSTATTYHVALRIGGQPAYDRSRRDAAQRAIQVGRMLDGMACGIDREEALRREIARGASDYRNERTVVEVQRQASRRREAVSRVEAGIAAVRRERIEAARKAALMTEIQAAGRAGRTASAR